MKNSVGNFAGGAMKGAMQGAQMYNTFKTAQNLQALQDKVATANNNFDTAQTVRNGGSIMTPQELNAGPGGTGTGGSINGSTTAKAGQTFTPGTDTLPPDSPQGAMPNMPTDAGGASSAASGAADAASSAAGGAATSAMPALADMGSSAGGAMADMADAFA